MTPAQATAMADRTLDMLARERDLLRDGRYAELERLTAERDACLARLLPLERPVAEAIAPKLERLRKGLARNGAILRAAMDGVRAARRRIAAIAAAGAELSGYDASGMPRHERFPAGGADRRA